MTKIKDCIDNFAKDNEFLQDKCLFWDLLKCKIRGMTVSHASYKAKERRSYETALNKQIDKLENTASLSDNDNIEYQTLKKEYDEIQKEKAYGIMIRSRANYTEFGEKNTKYFLNLEKRNQEIKHIRCLMTENQELIYKPADILNEQMSFYKNLYTETDSNRDKSVYCAEFPDNPDMKKLSQKQKDICEMTLTQEECGVALKQLANNKSPGSDGFPTEFLQFVLDRYTQTRY